MKDGKFETQAEIFKALLDGEKIKNIYWPDGDFVHLVNGELTQGDCLQVPWCFNNPDKWSIYEEPKPKKKVTLYRYTMKHRAGSVYETAWDSREFKDCDYVKILKTESKEVEYDDV